MAREVPEIDRLIEEGLTLYGQGDLDGALLVWEKALVIDPDNAQANSYVDYVRANYELLTNDKNGEATAEGAPFGIADDEPEYQIEIQPGEIRPTNPTISPPLFMDPMDEGWFIDEETRDSSGDRGPPGIDLDGRPSQELTMELEADEPPAIPLPTAPRPAPVTIQPRSKRESAVGMEFDDTTQEYDKKRSTLRPPEAERAQPVPVEQKASSSDRPTTGTEEFGPDGTPGFGHPNDFQTPPGFGTQTTGIKQRDLGFVKATAEKPPMSATYLGLPNPHRTPAKPSVPPPPEPVSSMDDLTLEPHTAKPPADEPNEFDELELDLITSLPSPRPAPAPRKIEVDTPLSGASKPVTREFPHQTRAPAVPSAKTKELSPSDLVPMMSSTQTQDFEVKTQERDRQNARTRDLPPMQNAYRPPEADNPVVSAPTRDLGLREAAIKPPVGEGTRADVVLAFDPIDARSTEILEDVDETAPAKEAPEDKTRRRITTLFERAAQWSSEGDLERSVAAIDLALSEDPNAALAQKLIHRNRETIMSVFQAYLGDLQRTPQLARPLHELANAPISPRAAFLLSRIDGLLSIDEILDVCGMPRLEAYRYLCQLFLRGILR